MISRPSPTPYGAIKAAIWTYFFFLIWEGALRKWVLPGLSDLIFIIRDPIVLAIYFLASRERVFPWRPAIALVIGMAAVSMLFSITTNNRLLVALFGVRTDFLHLPLIFIMGQVLNRRDVVRYGRWFIFFSVPILILMQRQFTAAPDDWLNVTVGGTVGGQLRGAMGKIRPPGPFSFISGPVCFFSMLAAFVFYGWLQSGTYRRSLLILATGITIFAVPISISRSLLLGVIIVATFGLAVTLRDPRRIPGFMGPLIATTAFLAFMADSIYVQAFETRWDEALAASSGGFQENVEARAVTPFLQPFEIAASTPWTGYGIGLGTVGGGRLQTGKYTFLLSESELARIVLELGPLLGFVFIAWRAWITLSLIGGSWRSFRATGDPLAWLIVGSCFMNILVGQWGPTTQLGFAIFGAGLALAAMNPPPEEEESPEHEGADISDEGADARGEHAAIEAG